MGDLQIITHNGERVLTTARIAEQYGTDGKIIQRNYSNNRNRYVEGKHYYRLTGEALKAMRKNYGLPSNLNTLYLWTEKGALLHAKSLNTDKAWQVYEFLVDNYFRNKPQTASPTKYEQLTLEGNNSARAVLDVAGYSYQDKTFNGDPVVTLNDIAYITGISADSLKYVLKTHGAYGRDYFKISGAQMIKFKQQNTSCPRCWTHLILVTKSGFTLLAKYYNLTNNTPQCFITDNKPAVVEKPKKSVSVPAAHRPTTDEYIIALNVLRYLNDTNKKLCEETDTMKDYYRSSIESMDAAIKNIGTAISVG